jgi:hypothetical protein
MKKYLFHLSLTIIALLFTLGCGGSNKVAVTSVSIKASTNLIIGRTETLSPTIQPSNATNKDVTWSSSNSTVASVNDDGLVRGVAKGSATIKVTTKDGDKTAECVVTVAEDMSGVYVVGLESHGETDAAMLWKDNKANRIGNPETLSAEANSVFVTDSDVYVAGKEEYLPVKFSAALWKNGNVTLLGAPEALYSEAHSVYVYGNDVYVAGMQIDKLGNVDAMLWKNGAATRLNDQPGYAVARSVFVYQGDVYVAGHEVISERLIATVWNKGNAKRLIDPNDGRDTQSMAFSIFVSGNDVYVAGGEGNLDERLVSTLWKGNEASYEAIRLSEQATYAIARSVFVSGSDVYVAGDAYFTGGSVAVLWKIGDEPTRLCDPANLGSANSVFVSGGDVYVAGEEYISGEWVATLWKNEAATRLGKNESFGQSVFVK